MKKALALLTMCAAFSSAASAETIANADTKGSQPVRPEAKTDNPNYPWLNNINANISFVTNYMFRGISQSRNLPAVQGGFTYNSPFNIYVSAWGSNVKFDGTDATVEIDGILGYANTYGDDFAYDINIARYFYPSANTLNYNEINTLFNWRFLQFGVSYSANVYNVHKTGIYYQGGVNWDVPENYVFGVCDVNLTALLGHYSLPRAAGNSYNDYLIGLSKKFDHYKLGVQWTNTNGRQKSSPIDGSTFLAMVSADL